ncbi:MAG: ATP-binding protein [Sphingomonas bacterium]
MAAGAALWVQRENDGDARLVAHTLAVEAAIGTYASANERMETARRGLLLTNSATFARAMAEAEAKVRDQKRVLDGLIEDNPSQLARTSALQSLLDDYDAHHRRWLALDQAGRRRFAADFASDEGVDYIRRSRQIIDAMLHEELQLLRSREQGQSRTQSLFLFTLIATGSLILIVAIATLLLVRRNLVALHQSRIELHRLNEDLEDMVEARTAELQRANAEIQRFAYIVSHDLRSPLVNVMGFTAELEVARKLVADYLAESDAQGWKAPDPETRRAVEEDLPEAIGFIRSSTQKMDRLINAILNLSRQGRRMLSPERLDLTALARGIADSLEHRIQETGTTLKISPLPAVVSDRLAIEQILSNLIENALKYLKPGRPGMILVSGGIEWGRVFINVSDNGRGIDPRDHERIFDLFRRSGAQDQPGEGIGLAHARALAYRLGGKIEVQSTLGEGSTFRLNLPKEWRGGEDNAGSATR